MAQEKPVARWKLVLGYTAFSFAALVFGLMVTFPYDTLRRRAVDAAADQGLAVRIGALRPGLRGLTATQVKVSKVPGGMTPELRSMLNGSGPLPGPEELGEPFIIDSVAVRPSLLPLGVAFHLNVMGGSISGSAGGLKDTQVLVRLANLDPAAGNFKGLSGVDMVGKINGVLDVTLPRTRGQPDLTQANGQLTLGTEDLIIQGGNITVPMYGQPTPMDLPRLALGDLDGRVRIEKGLATVDTLQAKSEDLEIQGSGTLKLGQRLDVSQPDMDFKLRLEPAATQRLGILGSGLTILPPDKTDGRFRVAHLSGFLNRPNFGPARQQPNMR